jgi:hypothetical protein
MDFVDPLEDPANAEEFFRLTDDFGERAEKGFVDCLLTSPNEVVIRAVQGCLEQLGYTVKQTTHNNLFVLCVSMEAE